MNVAGVTSGTSGRRQVTLTIGALGIVFGDIGTSPLYAFREAVRASGYPDSPEAILGVLSTIVWSILLVVTVKYVILILRTDNEGEGGVLALATLLDLHRTNHGPGRIGLLYVALAGAGLLFGDSIITPSISVLSAVEGIEVWSPEIADTVVPIAVCILVALFVVQRFGTRAIGNLFGPVMFLWFAILISTGLQAIALRPGVLRALSPVHALQMFADAPGTASAILGAAFLAVTGGEALYADLGLFGRPAITRAWLLIVMPALLINYFGQGALLLSHGGAVANPFYGLFPAILVLPATLLATAATIIASQAVITGLFSIGQQAIELGLFPPLQIIYTDPENEHSVYLPAVNNGVAIFAVALTIGFGSASSLANAYGIAVAGAMITTTVLYLAVLAARNRGRTRNPLWVLACLLLGLDLVFVFANLSKFGDGGFVPLVLGLVALIISHAWRIGRLRMAATRSSHARELTDLVADLEHSRPTTQRVGVFLLRPGRRTSAPLQQLTELVGIRFSQVVLVSLWTAARPHVPPDEGVTFVRLGSAAVRVDVHIGYMQRINLPALLAPTLATLDIATETVTYVVGLERPIAPRFWRGPNDVMLSLFAVLAKLASRSTDRFALPRARTLEIGVPKRL